MKTDSTHWSERALKLTLFLVLIGWLLIPNAAHCQALQASSSDTRRAIFDSHAFSGPSTPLPVWDNGYLVSRDIETFEEGVSNVRLYDQSGRQVGQASIWFPDSQRVLIYSAAATPDGRIVAAGKAEKVNGAHASFITLVSLTGQMTPTIQTGSFLPTNICYAPDGTVWSFGSTGYDADSNPNPGGVLRHFDFQKGEIGSYLPRSSFPERPDPSVVSHIRCSSEGIQAYSSKAQAYIEMKYGDTAPRVYHAQTPANLRLAGFATNGSKTVYGFFSRGGNGGLYYLYIDPTADSAQWLPAQGAVGALRDPGVITMLWGSDGNQLVVSRAEDSVGLHAFHWATPAH